jgi:hypothetical protein
MTDTIDLALVRQGDALLAEAYRLAGDHAETLATRQAQWIASDMVEKDVSMDTAPQRGRPRQAPTVAVSVRMTTDLLDRVDAYIDTLAARIPGLRLERSRGICLMLERLLELEAGISQPQPAQVSPTTQPALPLALEGVPASQAQPLAPAPQQEGQPKTIQAPHASPGMVHCPVNPTHRSYPASAKECPMCANNRRTRASKSESKTRQLRQSILTLLRQRPEGLDVSQVDFELGLGKRGRESSTSTLQGMVEDGHLLEKQGSGETMRYVVAPSA